jgi:hypothetical protein
MFKPAVCETLANTSKNTKRTAVFWRTHHHHIYQVQLTCSYLFGLHRWNQLAENTNRFLETHALETALCFAEGITQRRPVCSCLWRMLQLKVESLRMIRRSNSHARDAELLDQLLGFHGFADPTHTHVMLCLHCCGAFSQHVLNFEHERRVMRQLKAELWSSCLASTCVWCCFVEYQVSLSVVLVLHPLGLLVDAMCCS